MSSDLLRKLALWAVFCPVLGWTQVLGISQMPEEQVNGGATLDKALETSSLTLAGSPFHAVMEVGTAGSTYSGRIEVWWVDSLKYRVALTSPQFSQNRIVNGDRVFEKNEGDYYPRWLENFVLAILDPAPMKDNFSGTKATVMQGPPNTYNCLRRDDRSGGITDQLTWGTICFSGSQPMLESVRTMNVYLRFEDWKQFGKKQIARTYETGVLDFQPIVGRLTTLEELQEPDEAMFAVSTVTPREQRISTAFVSTLKEESLLEKAPEIQWPSVREGKTDGYMIVYARTDRTGQVRETAKHNSDQPGLESFGMAQALKYKFKPLIVDGVEQQMEMPLVLHFTSRLDNPLLILTVDQMKQQTSHCDRRTLPPDTPKGTKVTIRVSVDETGKTTGMSPVGPGSGRIWLPAMESLNACKFKPYIVNGQATYYKGDVELTAP